MSGFLVKRNSNLGGAVPASSPNVGQYGWTSYETAHYNQMVEYVGLAKEAQQTATDAAVYTKRVLDVEIRPAVEAITNSEERVTKSVASFARDYTQFLSDYSDFKTMYGNIFSNPEPFVFSAGWGNYGETFSPYSCTLVGSVVVLGGLVTRVSGTSTTVGVLPEAVRPVLTKIFSCACAGGTTRVDITPAGEILVVQDVGSSSQFSTWLSLENITYSL